jgi:acyl-CoA synthetase (AMP-forming)/AMP-acid ligase II
MTETGAGAVVIASLEPRHVGTSCFGRLGSELEARIVADGGAEAGVDQPGELLVRHAGAAPRYGFFREYLKDAEATAETWDDGWFHTGDVVRRGPDGAFHFVDRKKNVIRRSGENISAVEVESVLMQHPSVKQVAVAPAPDPVRGDEVFACVVSEAAPTDAAARNQIAADIVEWCLSRLAYYKARLCRVRLRSAADLDAENPARRAQGACRRNHRLRAVRRYKGAEEAAGTESRVRS